MAANRVSWPTAGAVQVAAGTQVAQGDIEWIGTRLSEGATACAGSCAKIGQCTAREDYGVRYGRPGLSFFLGLEDGGQPGAGRGYSGQLRTLAPSTAACRVNRWAGSAGS